MDAPGRLGDRPGAGACSEPRGVGFLWNEEPKRLDQRLARTIRKGMDRENCLNFATASARAGIPNAPRFTQQDSPSAAIAARASLECIMTAHGFTLFDTAIGRCGIAW